MPETAKRYGLRVDKDIDERYNFEKATDAALTYLKKMYDDDFQNWTLAAAAYNR
jgi:soluble lytic murein transglycosylase-like protein